VVGDWACVVARAPLSSKSPAVASARRKKELFFIGK
jgi:hypothetical protein